MSAKPVRNCCSRSARPSALSDISSHGAGASCSVHTASAIDTAASAEKIVARPASAAAAPSTGPNIAPNTAAPIAFPSAWPRRSRGVAAMSHGSAPDHMKPPLNPCSRRAPKSIQKSFAKPKPRLAAPMSASPSKTARRGPNHDAATPPEMPPTSAPVA